MAEDPLLPPLLSQRAAARARGKSAPAPAKPPKAPPERLGRHFGFGAVVVIAAFALFVWWGRAHPPPTDDYNNFRFVRDQNYWYTEVEVGGRPLTVPFYSHPRDLADIPVDPSAPGTVLALRDGAGALIIALDPEAGAVPVQAGVQISRLTGSRFQVLKPPQIQPNTGHLETTNLLVRFLKTKHQIRHA